MFIRILAILLMTWWIFGAFLTSFDESTMTPPKFKGPVEAPNITAPNYPPPNN